MTTRGQHPRRAHHSQGDHGRQHNAAHRRRSTLRQVLCRLILADEFGRSEHQKWMGSGVPITDSAIAMINVQR